MKFFQFFGIELRKIHLIDSTVFNFKNRKIPPPYWVGVIKETHKDLCFNTLCFPVKILRFVLHS